MLRIFSPIRDNSIARRHNGSFLSPSGGRTITKLAQKPKLRMKLTEPRRVRRVAKPKLSDLRDKLAVKNIQGEGKRRKLSIKISPNTSSESKRRELRCFSPKINMIEREQLMWEVNHIDMINKISKRIEHVKRSRFGGFFSPQKLSSKILQAFSFSPNQSMFPEISKSPMTLNHL